MPRFLVATDGSETALKAAEVAVEEAELHGASLLVVTVMDREDFSRKKRREWSRFYEELKGEGERRANEVVETAEERGVEAETEVREGTPYREILRSASENDADRIFIGTVGRSGVSEIFLGSTAERIIRGTSVPTTVVPVRQEKAS